MFAQYKAAFDFTALELTDNPSCSSAPQELVKQVITAAVFPGVFSL
jgi:hypothetical protein